MAIYVNYLFNRLMAPTHEFRMLDDGDIEEFIDRCDEITKRNYRKLQIGAAKADLWRLLTVQNYGGVYMDMDATLVWPLDLTLGRYEEVFLTVRGDPITNYFFASVPNSPHLGALIDAVNRNIAENATNSVYELTGPIVFQTVLKDRPVENFPAQHRLPPRHADQRVLPVHRSPGWQVASGAENRQRREGLSLFPR